MLPKPHEAGQSKFAHELQRLELGLLTFDEAYAQQDLQQYLNMVVQEMQHVLVSSNAPEYSWSTELTVLDAEGKDTGAKIQAFMPDVEVEKKGPARFVLDQYGLHETVAVNLAAAALVLASVMQRSMVSASYSGNFVSELKWISAESGSVAEIEVTVFQRTSVYSEPTAVIPGVKELAFVEVHKLAAAVRARLEELGGSKRLQRVTVYLPALSNLRNDVFGRVLGTPKRQYGLMEAFQYLYTTALQSQFGVLGNFSIQTQFPSMYPGLVLAYNVVLETVKADIALDPAIAFARQRQTLNEYIVAMADFYEPYRFVGHVLDDYVLVPKKIMDKMSMMHSVFSSATVESTSYETCRDNLSRLLQVTTEIQNTGNELEARGISKLNANYAIVPSAALEEFRASIQALWDSLLIPDFPVATGAARSRFFQPPVAKAPCTPLMEKVVTYIEAFSSVFAAAELFREQTRHAIAAVDERAEAEETAVPKVSMGAAYQRDLTEARELAEELQTRLRAAEASNDAAKKDLEIAVQEASEFKKQVLDRKSDVARLTGESETARQQAKRMISNLETELVDAKKQLETATTQLNRIASRSQSDSECRVKLAKAKEELRQVKAAMERQTVEKMKLNAVQLALASQQDKYASRLESAATKSQVKDTKYKALLADARRKEAALAQRVAELETQERSAAESKKRELELQAANEALEDKIERLSTLLLIKSRRQKIGPSTMDVENEGIVRQAQKKLHNILQTWRQWTTSTKPVGAQVWKGYSEAASAANEAVVGVVELPKEQLPSGPQLGKVSRKLQNVLELTQLRHQEAPLQSDESLYFSALTAQTLQAVDALQNIAKSGPTAANVDALKKLQATVDDLTLKVSQTSAELADANAKLRRLNSLQTAEQAATTLEEVRALRAEIDALKGELTKRLATSPMQEEKVERELEQAVPLQEPIQLSFDMSYDKFLLFLKQIKPRTEGVLEIIKAMEALSPAGNYAGYRRILAEYIESVPRDLCPTLKTRADYTKSLTSSDFLCLVRKLQKLMPTSYSVDGFNLVDLDDVDARDKTLRALERKGVGKHMLGAEGSAKLDEVLTKLDVTRSTDALLVIDLLLDGDFYTFFLKILTKLFLAYPNRKWSSIELSQMFINFFSHSRRFFVLKPGRTNVEYAARKQDIEAAFDEKARAAEDAFAQLVADVARQNKLNQERYVREKEEAKRTGSKRASDIELRTVEEPDRTNLNKTLEQIDLEKSRALVDLRIDFGEFVPSTLTAMQLFCDAQLRAAPPPTGIAFPTLCRNDLEQLETQPEDRWVKVPTKEWVKPAGAKAPEKREPKAAVTKTAKMSVQQKQEYKQFEPFFASSVQEINEKRSEQGLKPIVFPEPIEAFLAQFSPQALKNIGDLVNKDVDFMFTLRQFGKPLLRSLYEGLLSIVNAKRKKAGMKLELVLPKEIDEKVDEDLQLALFRPDGFKATLDDSGEALKAKIEPKRAAVGKLAIPSTLNIGLRVPGAGGPPPFLAGIAAARKREEEEPSAPAKTSFLAGIKSAVPVQEGGVKRERRRSRTRSRARTSRHRSKSQKRKTSRHLKSRRKTNSRAQKYSTRYR